MTEKRFDHPRGLGFVHVREVLTVTDGGTWPVRFEVTTPTGYRATLPACPCVVDYPDRTPCALKYGHTKSARGRAEGCDGSNAFAKGFCHAWHWPRVERFAADVLATFGTGGNPAKVGAVGVPRGSRYVERAYVRLPIAA